MNPQPPDVELVARAKQGELDAFEELVRLHQRGLFAYVYRMCRDPDEAEEMTQQALVKAWRGLGRFQGRSSFKTWLYRIATNLCINRVTRRKPTVELPETLAAPDSEEPAENYERRRREELVQEALGRLPEDQRSALVLATWNDMSYKEIAESMGKTVKAVDSLLVRARQSMKRILAPARQKGML